MPTARTHARAAPSRPEPEGSRAWGHAVPPGSERGGGELRLLTRPCTYWARPLTPRSRPCARPQKEPGQGLSLLHFASCLRSQKKFLELPALKKNEKEEKKWEQAALVSRLGAAWARSYLHSGLRGLGDAGDRPGSWWLAPTCGRREGSLPSLSGRGGPGIVLAAAGQSQGVLVTVTPPGGATRTWASATKLCPLLL
ncbi:PREDICTED: uncharacterized protein LOC105575146 [Cercocebus atys]|uniref:uncharacterized protein LOC105575146 n=1 Tax=Cercocebus atys TaxID=9531 RepID=UPI0005F4B110|nr:PREDICTED: uncharacterized protein LOC105575146 [Cercocebus atys]